MEVCRSSYRTVELKICRSSHRGSDRSYTKFVDQLIEDLEIHRISSNWSRNFEGRK